MRKFAQERGINVLDGIAENLPFKHCAFDFALMVTTICFVDDLKEAFRETYRVLKERGSFINGFIDQESLIGRIYERNKEETYSIK